MRFPILFAAIATIAAPVFALAPGWAAATLTSGFDHYRAGRYPAAHTAFDRLADHGSAIGETMLGVMYARGQGVVADPATAATYYFRAAERGYPPAQLAFARALADGRGIARDPGKAWLWARLAQQRGDVRTEKAAKTLAVALETQLAAAARPGLERRLTSWRPWATGVP